MYSIIVSQSAANVYYTLSTYCSLLLPSSFVCRVAQNGTILYALTLPNINRFSELFRSQNQEKICNNTITKDPTTLQVCRYITL